MQAAHQEAESSLNPASEQSSAGLDSCDKRSSSAATSSLESQAGMSAEIPAGHASALHDAKPQGQGAQSECTVRAEVASGDTGDLSSA